MVTMRPKHHGSLTFFVSFMIYDMTKMYFVVSFVILPKIH